jgi:hypothetical protein
MKKNGKNLVCKFCNKIFYVCKSKIVGNEPTKYCSRTCWMSVHKTGKYVKICLGCSKEFYVNFARINTAKFCSYKCMNKHNGKIYMGENHPRWTGLTPIYQLIRNNELSMGWRNEVFKRDNYICQECKNSNGGNLNAHHIKSFNSILREFLNIYNQFSPIEDTDILLRLAERYEPFWDIKNGETLCENCHNKIRVEV